MTTLELEKPLGVPPEPYLHAHQQWREGNSPQPTRGVASGDSPCESRESCGHHEQRIVGRHRKVLRGIDRRDKQPPVAEAREECKGCLLGRVQSIGREVAFNAWGDAPRYFKRQGAARF